LCIFAKIKKKNFGTCFYVAITCNSRIGGKEVIEKLEEK
jgi:hypothetical protein